MPIKPIKPERADYLLFFLVSIIPTPFAIEFMGVWLGLLLGAAISLPIFLTFMWTHNKGVLDALHAIANDFIDKEK